VNVFEKIRTDFKQR